jgi:ABC-type multidrug transport system fused ATPase/permease subunit
MDLLYGYLKGYWKLVALALVLATVNQVFSLLDPLIFRHVIDEYATRFQDYTTGEFFRGVSLLLAAAVGVAFVSRVAKNFQDYYINVITQRLGARIYADGIRHSLELPYQVFEDQRSGETLGTLQKVRSDVERLVTSAISVLFTSLVGIAFVVVYAFSVHWIIAPVYFLTVPLLGVLSSVLSRKIKVVQKEHRAGQEPGACPAGNQTSQRHHRQDPASRAHESALHPQSQLRTGHLREPVAHEHPLPDALPDLHAGHLDRAVLLAVHLLVLHLRPAAGAWQHHQRLP